MLSQLTYSFMCCCSRLSYLDIVKTIVPIGNAVKNQNRMANSTDPDETVYNALHCLQKYVLVCKAEWSKQIHVVEDLREEMHKTDTN